MIILNWKGVCRAYKNPISESSARQTSFWNKRKTWKAHIVSTKDISQSLDVGITSTRVETFVAPTMDVVKKGVLIGSTTNMGSGLNGVLVRRKLSESTTLPTVIIGVVKTP